MAVWYVRLPASVTASFAGIGNPHLIQPIDQGATVLDMGCGAGTDLLLAALHVGPTGRAIGIDMTDAMVARARAGAAALGCTVIPTGTGQTEMQVAAIRDALDEGGFEGAGILAYAAKFASSFYGPFREAAECAPRFGDRAGYQMDPPNADEAIREVAADIDEGADVVMVKPALPYLDVIRRAKDATRFPMAAYNVSGEYAMLKAAAQNGWLDERKAVLEVLTSIRRAGADLVLTYHAKDAADWLAT